jgi:polysaccharide biosynthesis/export protein
MRATRSLIAFLAVSVAAAGCAQQRLAYVPMASAPMAAAPVASAPGIDNVVYGQASATPQTYPPKLYMSAAAPNTASAAATGYAAPPPPPSRYIMAQAAGYAPPAVANNYVMAPAAGYVAPPSPTRGLFNMAPVAPPQAGSVPAPARGYVNAAMPPMAPPAAYAPGVNEGPYTLDSGDRLRIVVFGQDGLTNSYAVDASGHIAMPLIGSALARGATTDQLANRIAEKLQNGYIREPHVAVEIEAYRPFFILGEVTAPGQYPFVANMTVETAVAIAGGFGPRGVRDHVTITRDVGGRLFRFAAPTTYPIRPGDTIAVPERWF